MAPIPPALGVMLLSLLAEPPAATAPARAPSWLAWTRGAGAESCVDAAGFAARVEAELGAAAVRDAAIRRRVAVNIGRGRASGTGAPPPWSADLRMVAANGALTGSRHLERAGGSCDSLTDGLALMVALLLAGDDHSLAASPKRATATATGPAPASPAPASPVPAAGTVAAPVPAARVPWSLAIEGGPSIGVGGLPGLAAALEARIWATPGSGPALFATGHLWRSQRARVAGSAGSGADLDLWTVGAGVCPLAPRVGAGPVFAACAVADLGRLGAIGFGFGRSLGGRRWTGDAGVEADVRQRLGARAYLSFGLRLVAALIRDNIAYRVTSETTISVFRVAPVITVAALRVGMVFP